MYDLNLYEVCYQCSLLINKLIKCILTAYCPIISFDIHPWYKPDCITSGSFENFPYRINNIQYMVTDAKYKSALLIFMVKSTRKDYVNYDSWKWIL